jgi:hypothetical protein
MLASRDIAQGRIFFFVNKKEAKKRILIAREVGAVRAALPGNQNFSAFFLFTKKIACFRNHLG